jgi:hypothetical protein
MRSASYQSSEREQEAFEPTETPVENSKLMKNLLLSGHYRPLLSPLLAVDLAASPPSIESPPAVQILELRRQDIDLYSARLCSSRFAASQSMSCSLPAS